MPRRRNPLTDPYNTAPSKPDPWAGERVKADRRKKKNRLPKSSSERLQLVKHLRLSKPYFSVSALRYGKRTWINRQGKLSRERLTARKVPTAAIATKAARALIAKYPSLARYRFSLHRGY